MHNLLWDFCSSDRRFACTFLQILPRDRHPWCSAIFFPLPGEFGTLTLKKCAPPGAHWKGSKQCSELFQYIIFSRFVLGNFSGYFSMMIAIYAIIIYLATSASLFAIGLVVSPGTIAAALFCYAIVCRCNTIFIMASPMDVLEIFRVPDFSRASTTWGYPSSDFIFSIKLA